MKKPDRYDRMVDLMVGNTDGVQRFGITNAGAAALLRYQHAVYVKKVAEWKDKARWKHTHDDSLELELQQRLATTTVHLEAQRTATYQAVAREHTAKKQLALVRKGQP